MQEKRQKKKRNLSRAAQCAAAIRKELKQMYPGVKFSVRSENYSGGDSVRINWTDGPELSEVEAIASKYEAGHFDGMTDCYVYNKDRDTNRPCAKFVFANKKFSDEATQVLKKRAEKLLIKFRGEFQPIEAEKAIRAELQRREARKEQEQIQEQVRKMPDNVVCVDFVRRKVI
jgi:hypothetical protein